VCVNNWQIIQVFLTFFDKINRYRLTAFAHGKPFNIIIVVNVSFCAVLYALLKCH